MSKLGWEKSHFSLDNEYSSQGECQTSHISIEFAVDYVFTAAPRLLTGDASMDCMEQVNHHPPTSTHCQCKGHSDQLEQQGFRLLD